MKIIRANDIVDKAWSGGKTSQLYVYPETSEYKRLDFKFRLSKATIETETSLFTTLPNVKRELMVTEGVLQLNHQNHYNKQLKPYQTDQFLGDWQTHSVGKAADFNLMMMGKTEGYLQHFYTKQPQQITIDSECDQLIIHLLAGKAQTDGIELNEHDTCVNATPETETLINMTKNTHIIITRIWLHD